MSEKLLVELSDELFSRSVFRAFLRRLGTIDDTERAKVLLACENHSEDFVLRTSFGLSNDELAALNALVTELCKAQVVVRIEEHKEFIAGFELSLAGVLYSWRLDEFLEHYQSSTGGMEYVV